MGGVAGMAEEEANGLGIQNPHIAGMAVPQPSGGPQSGGQVGRELPA